jgi:ferredoxin
MRIVVDRDLCEANAVCVRTAPALFRIDENDRMEVLADRPEGEALEKARIAARRCPRRALTLVEE